MLNELLANLNMETLLATVVGVVIGAILVVLKTGSNKLLKAVKDSETKLDDEILVLAVKELNEKGLVSDTVKKKVDNELDS